MCPPCTVWWCGARMPPRTRRCSPPSCRRNWTPPNSSTTSRWRRPASSPQASGLPQEVVYLYNGPGGTSFDTTLKPSLVDALKSDVPYLKSIGDFADLDVGGFVQDEPLRAVFGARGLDYDAARAQRQPVRARRDPRWQANCGWTEPTPLKRSPTRPPCCRRSGTRSPAGPRSARPTFPTPSWAPGGSPTRRSGCATAADYRPFGTAAGAHRYLAAHPGARHRGLPTGTGRFAMTVDTSRALSRASRRGGLRHPRSTRRGDPPRRGGRGCCGWRRWPRRSGCGRCSPPARCGCWLRFDTLPTVTEIATRADPTARGLRVLA